MDNERRQSFSFGHAIALAACLIHRFSWMARFILPRATGDRAKEEEMRTMHGLVHMYQKGAITADHLVVESLHKIDPNEPGLVLSILPREVLERMLIYAGQYRPGAMRTNYGVQPASDQVAAAKRWIEANLRGSNGAAALNPDCVERS